jgi:hypothetical protein
VPQQLLHRKLNTILSDEPPRNCSDSQSNLITSALPVIRSEYRELFMERRVLCYLFKIQSTRGLVEKVCV